MSDSHYIRIMPVEPNDYDIAEYLKPSSKLRDFFSTNHYMCLPLTAANTLGWTLYNPFPFTVSWLGGDGLDRIEITCEKRDWAVSWFGYGTFTILPQFVVETSPGINLLVRPVPNYFKMPVMTMDGIVETDWLQASFTLNFRMMLPRFKVRYEVGEPLVQFVPYTRQFIEDFDAEIVTEGEDYDRRMEALAQIREQRQRLNAAKMRGEDAPHDLDYLRGVNSDGSVFADHKKTFHLKAFKRRQQDNE